MSLAIDLFVGNYETIEIQTGNPASIETPITIRQSFLYADECACFEQTDIDFTEMYIFDNWLKENYETVLPEEKSIVGVRPRKTPKDYQDPWEKMLKQKYNFYSHLIIRNGENIYRIPLPYMIGSTLIMSGEDYMSQFDGIKPGTRAYGAALEKAEDQTRHQMITVLLMQGLVDNQTVFEPLVPNSINFLDSSTINILMEKENALPDLTDDFKGWHKDNIKNVGVGMRIVGNFNRYLWKSNYKNDNELIHPPNAENPSSEEVHVIKSREYNYYGEEFLKFTYKRTQEIWKGRYEGYVEANSHASFKIPINRNVPIICADTCTLEDVTKYMHSKSGRENYETMVPLLKTVHKYLTNKQTKEKPVRIQIEKELKKMVLPNEFIDLWTNTAIELWQRRQRNWRDIFDDSEKSVKEISGWIVKLFGLTKQPQYQDIDLIGKELKKIHPKAIWIGLDITGKINVLEPHCQGSNVWLVWNQYKKNTNNEYKSTKLNQLTLYKPVFGGMYTINSETRWDEWIKDAKEKEVINPAEALKLAEKYLTYHCDINDSETKKFGITVNNSYVESNSPVQLHPEINQGMEVQRDRHNDEKEDEALALPCAVTIDSKYQNLRLWVAVVEKPISSPFEYSNDDGKYIKFRFHKSKTNGWLLFYKSTYTPKLGDHPWDKDYHGNKRAGVIISLNKENIKSIEKGVEKKQEAKTQFNLMHNVYRTEVQQCRKKYKELVIAHHRTQFMLNYQDLSLFDEYLKDLDINQNNLDCYLSEIYTSLTWFAWKNKDPFDSTILEILETAQKGLEKIKTHRDDFTLEEIRKDTKDYCKEGFEALLKLKLSEICQTTSTDE